MRRWACRQYRSGAPDCQRPAKGKAPRANGNSADRPRRLYLKKIRGILLPHPFAPLLYPLGMAEGTETAGAAGKHQEVSLPAVRAADPGKSAAGIAPARTRLWTLNPVCRHVGKRLTRSGLRSSFRITKSGPHGQSARPAWSRQSSFKFPCPRARPCEKAGIRAPDFGRSWDRSLWAVILDFSRYKRDSTSRSSALSTV